MLTTKVYKPTCKQYCILMLAKGCDNLGIAFTLYAINGIHFKMLANRGWRFTGSRESIWAVCPDGFAYPVSASGRISDDPIAKLDRIGNVRQWTNQRY